jgi:hypothetical protein
VSLEIAGKQNLNGRDHPIGAGDICNLAANTLVQSEHFAEANLLLSAV